MAANKLLSSSSLLNKYCSECHPQCSVTDFILQISSSQTPVESQMNNIKSFVENTSIPLPADWKSNWRNYIYKNYLMVSVVLENPLIEQNTQSASIGFGDLVSNIGGQTGLWIGISFLSIMEIIEMLFELIKHQYYLLR